ncbi:hypothetical protein EZV62_012418 [Acer yangbiense]|uniref:DWNN domain-containing protein n=1 Tax=Acer yangbiense TaxID=1000413 RepID=A0A5C7HW83_9ROSI|nr:hypothetical protein EZV62_012418 [Acer yangbiense]
MAVYYRFKSARGFDSISMDGPLISVGTLKEKIYESKHLGGTDSDLLVTNAQTNEEYTGAMLIPRNTSVLIRRVPGRPRMLEPQPPQGYVCHRCKVPDGSYALPSGAVAVLRPNEAAFEKEIEGLPSPTISAESKGELKQPPGFEETLVPKEIADEGKAVIAPPQTRIAAKAPDVSEATHESMSVKEPAPASQVQQQKKKKKQQQPCMPSNDLQWKTYPQDMMPLGPSAYNNPYWNDMQAGYVAPFDGAMPYTVMGYGMSPLDMPFGGVMPQDPFGAQGYMMPVVPPQREFPRDREYGREVSSSVGDVSSMKSKSKSIPQCSNADHHQRQWSIRSSPEPQSLRPSKRKSDHSHHDRDSDYDHDNERERDHRSESSSKPSSETAIKAASTTWNKKSKASVFSRINFPKQEAINAAKKRKTSSSSATTEASPFCPSQVIIKWVL